MPGPWRKVTNIENRYAEGKAGYEALTWFLTLECGHFKSVHGGRFIAARDMCKPIRTAPKKVRCEMCG